MATRKSIASLNDFTAVFLVLGIVVALNIVVGGVRLRKDMTDGQIYTLSQGTRTFLAQLDRAVTLKFYFSKSSEDVPPPVKQYGQRVLDLLREYQTHGGRKIVVETYDPQPDSDEEEWAQRYGLTAQAVGPIGTGPSFYMGLVASAGTREVALPFLAPAMEPRLEYYITRLIHEVTQTRKPRVGVMSPLPILGAPSFAQLGRPRERGWVFAEELRKQYDVVSVPHTATDIPADVDVLVLVHPRELSERTLFALDQFVLRGGRLLAFLDPFCIAERETEPAGPPVATPASDLNRLTKAWGLEMPAMDVVADLRAASPVSFGAEGSERLATWLSLRQENIDREDIGTSALDLLMLPFAGAFRGEPAEGLKMTRLVQTSDETSLVSAFQGTMPGVEKMRAARPEGKVPVAVRLQGRFRTAFPEGAPKETAGSDQDEAPREPEPEKTETLKESQKDGLVVLVSDVDMLFDRFAVQTLNFFGQTFFEPINDNLSFALNVVEQLAGSEALVGLRSRGSVDRPFDRVIELEKQAQQRWQQEELELLARLRETQARLNQLQREKSEDQRFILSPEQKQEIEKFRAQRFETQQRLKQVRKNLRRDIERLGRMVKVINMAAMPALVAAYGLVHGWRRRRKAS